MIDIGTLSGILQAEKELRTLFGEKSIAADYQDMVERVRRLTPKECGDLVVLLNRMKDHCRVLSTTLIPVSEAKTFKNTRVTHHPGGKDQT